MGNDASGMTSGQIGAYEMQLCCMAVGYGSFNPPLGDICCCIWLFLICIPTCGCRPSPPSGPLWDPVDKNRWNQLLEEADRVAATTRNACSANPWSMQAALDRDWLDPANQFLAAYNLHAIVHAWQVRSTDPNGQGQVTPHLAILILRGVFVDASKVQYPTPVSQPSQFNQNLSVEQQQLEIERLKLQIELEKLKQKQ